MDIFSGAEIKAVRAANALVEDKRKRARAAAIQTKYVLRRAKSEAVLADILPSDFVPGTSYHVISHGDVDALSYLRHVVKHRPLTHCAISTWCIARNDVAEVGRWLDSGLIEVMDWYVGEIFPGQYADAMALVETLVSTYGGRVVVARNHSKVILCADEKNEFYVAIEGSANVNTNPRIEQTAIHASKDLYLFYREFFDGLQTILPNRNAVRIRQNERGIETSHK